MTKLVTKHSIRWREADIADIKDSEVVAATPYPQNPIWDDTLQNVREKTPEELAADAASLKKQAALAERHRRVDLYAGADLRDKDSRLMLATDILDKQLRGETLSADDEANMAALRQVRPLIEAHNLALSAMYAEIDTLASEAEIEAYDVTDPAKWPGSD
jgi:hypothetical protein